MKANFNIFGVGVGICISKMGFDFRVRKVGYDVCVQQSDGILDDPIQSWYKARTKKGAQLKGWYFARKYAKAMGCDQDVLIYHDVCEYTGPEPDLVWWGTIPVRKVVGIWFKK